MQNDMNLIMENWRRFSQSESFSNYASKVLIETKSYNSSLDLLIVEHSNKKISTKKYINILQESIDKDLKELSKLEKEILNEALGDTIKKVGQNIKGAVTGAIDAVIKKVNDMIMKVSLMIWNAPRQAALNITKIIPYVRNFKNANPKVYAFLIVSLKIIGIIAIAYAFLHPGTAEASVPIDQYGSAAVDYGPIKMVDVSSTEGKQLLGALKALGPEHLQGTSLEGIDEERLKAASQILQQAVMKKEPQNIQGAFKTILDAANSLSKHAENSGDGGMLQKLGKHVMEVADIAVDKAGNIVKASSLPLNISGDTMGEKVGSLSKPENLKKIIDMFGGDNVSSMDASNLIKKALKYALQNNQISGEEYKSLLRGPAIDIAEEKMRLVLQQMGK